ncbi:hypothetical protein SY27_09145 [Flavobacterium sp. 316]|uniref:hypothetical protein n=1 Tax=Flavobacterium sp. 316 TaxID=1603293 RepID=UPI0005E527F4|nr:hypothetical protein [Flavobacterium sp. 316]KIX20940.1 hypothetical protein SY27_09145 [Flavobacterium sp. 316]
MNNLVKKHYDKDDIERQFINKDILLWKEEVDCINAEIVFFKQLLKNKKDNDIYSKIIEKLETKEKENNILLANLIFYIRKTDGLKECEDIECETYYLNDHILFKNNIESFLFQYKKLKRLAYLKINEQNNLT